MESELNKYMAEAQRRSGIAVSVLLRCTALGMAIETTDPDGTRLNLYRLITTLMLTEVRNGRVL